MLKHVGRGPFVFERHRDLQKMKYHVSIHKSWNGNTPLQFLVRYVVCIIVLHTDVLWQIRIYKQEKLKGLRKFLMASVRAKTAQTLKNALLVQSCKYVLILYHQWPPKYSISHKIGFGTLTQWFWIIQKDDDKEDIIITLTWQTPSIFLLAESSATFQYIVRYRLVFFARVFTLLRRLWRLFVTFVSSQMHQFYSVLVQVICLFPDDLIFQFLKKK